MPTPVRMETSKDTLSQWLLHVKEAQSKGLNHLEEVLKSCFDKFLSSSTVLFYQKDPRLVKLFTLCADVCERFDDVFRVMEGRQIGADCALRYAAYALFLERTKNFVRANEIYHLGLSRQAQPFSWLQRMHSKFLERLAELVKLASNQEVPGCAQLKVEDPWSNKTLSFLLSRLNSEIGRYKGYNSSSKNYHEKIWGSTFRATAHEKTLVLGATKYHLKQFVGEGGYACVYKAFIEGNASHIVALKIQHPPCVWEFYMYRQLDLRICPDERSHFGFAHELYLFPKCSILVCDYIDHGTLQDIINEYLKRDQLMDEVLCIYYTIEMLHIVELMHSAGLIHGDIKPDNLIIRYASDEVLEDWNQVRDGGWKKQGLCLIDFGRGIDLSLFPNGTEFLVDSKTKGFQCIEMLEKKPWNFQVDTFGLCAVAHVMLHGRYMEVIKEFDGNGNYAYHPKLAFKRYWNCELWSEFFSTLLNVKSCKENPDLSILRRRFEDYLSSNTQLKKKIRPLLLKQRNFTYHQSKIQNYYC